MLRKILMIVAAVAALATAAAVCVVALAFALYALVEPHVGAAGAGAVVAATAALTLLIAGLYLKGGAEGSPRAKHEEPAGMVDSVMKMARKRPLIAAGAAVVAGIYALRNPALLAAVLGAVMEKRSRPKD